MAGKHVFLSHYRDNRAEAERLRADLLAAGYDIRWDQDFEPNQDPYFEMRNAAEQSRAVLVCLSAEATAAKAATDLHVQARDVLELEHVQTAGTAVVPIRFSACVVPAFPLDEARTLDQLDAIDLFPEAQWQPGLVQVQAVLQQAFATPPPPQPERPTDTAIAQHLARVRPVTAQHEITQILQQAHQGDTAALNRLWRLVYDDIKQIARRQMRGERRDHVLSTTMLVHEAYIKLTLYKRITWRNRNHFYALSCEVMKRVLIDHARRRKALKRPPDDHRVPIDEAMPRSQDRPDRLLDLHRALQRLAEVDPRLGKIVECKFFGGLTMIETAEALGMKKRTVEREWKRARTHLYKMLYPDGRDSARTNP